VRRPRLGRLRAGELGGLAGDSLYMTVALGAISVADLLQMALVTHSVGLAEYGRLALVMSFVVLVGQFFDVRVGIAETAFGAQRIAARDWNGAASVIRFGYGIDGVTGVVGFLIIVATAPVVGPWLVGDRGAELMILYAFTLLASTVDGSSMTVLRLLGRFGLLATYMTGLEVLRVSAVALALYVEPSLTAVLVALVAYDVVGAAVNLLIATRVFSEVAGRSVFARTETRFDERRAMLRTVFHTNVVSYARIAQTQLPTLALGALTSTTQVGLYKVGASAAAIVGRIADPVYMSIFPRLSRLWAEKRRGEIERLLRQATPIAAVVVGGAFVGLVVLSSPILRLLGGPEATSATPVLVLVGAGYAVGGILFWIPGLLYAASRARVVSVVAVATAVLQIGLLVPLAMAWDSTGAAVALSASLIGSNLLMAHLGLRALKRPQDQGSLESITSDPRSTSGSYEY
jgi:O-antigen/teichoic acid export membrane protein